jgi:hypothetical protein
MKKSLLVGVALAVIASAPAMAAPICSGSFGLPREFYSESDINDYNQQMLRSYGVDASRVEIWGGCIRAYVRQPDGTEEMQFFEPLNFRRVG